MFDGYLFAMNANLKVMIRYQRLDRCRLWQVHIFLLIKEAKIHEQEPDTQPNSSKSRYYLQEDSS